MKKYDAAIADFSKAISMNPGQASYYDDLGYNYLEKKDYRSAVANFSQCLSRDDKYFDAMLGLAIAFYNQGDLEQTKSAIRRAVGAEPRLAEGMAGIEKVEKDGFEENISADRPRHPALRAGRRIP
jgi:tetratricopeptide (TPR) repeat protein